MRQKDVTEYWQGEALSYSESIKSDLESFKASAWLKLIEEYLPQTEGKPKILDVGTGPGFFPVILSKAGYDVSAIDCSENMIKEAQNNVRSANTAAEFYVMDSHEPDFRDETFDVVLNRNVTWTLHDPQKAYRSWYRILKTGGRLMVFDSNFAHRFVDEKLREKYDTAMKKANEQGYFRKGHVNQKLADEMTPEFFLTDKKRPQWDMLELYDVGFRKIFMDQDIIRRVYDEKDMALWSSIPMFLVCAEK